MVQDIQEINLLSYPDTWGSSEAVHALNMDSRGAAGLLMGGQFWHTHNACRDHTKFFWNLMQSFPAAMGPWAHDPESAKYMRKLVIHLAGSRVKTLPLAKLQGQSEIDRSAHAGGPTLTEKRRKVVINVDKKFATPYLAGAPQKPKQLASKDNICDTVTKLEDLILLARSKLPVELKSIGLVVYDITVAVNGTHIPDHTDEIWWDGGGACPMNICTHGDGLFAFNNERSDEVPLQAVYVGSNHYTVFGNALRYAATHQVLRMQDKPVALDMQLKRPAAEYRMVVTIRFGHPDKDGIAQWEELYKDHFDELAAKQWAELTREAAELELEVKNIEIATLKAAAAKTARSQPQRSPANIISKTSKRQRTNSKTTPKAPPKKQPPPKARTSPPTLVSDDSDPQEGDQFDTKSMYVYTGVAKRINLDSDEEAYTVQSLRLKRRDKPVVQMGTAFRLKSHTGTTAYLIVRVGMVILPRKNSKLEQCYVAWLLDKQGPARAWAKNVHPVEITWLLGRDGFVEPFCTQATPDALAAGEAAWEEYKRVCLGSISRRPSAKNRINFLRAKHESPSKRPELALLPMPPSPSSPPSTAISNNLFGEHAPARSQPTEQGSAVHRSIYGPEHTIYNDLHSASQNNSHMNMTIAALTLQNEKVLKEKQDAAMKLALAHAENRGAALLAVKERELAEYQQREQKINDDIRIAYMAMMPAPSTPVHPAAPPQALPVATTQALPAAPVQPVTAATSQALPAAPALGVPAAPAQSLPAAPSPAVAASSQQDSIAVRLFLSGVPMRVTMGLAMLKKDLGPENEDRLNDIHDCMTDDNNPLPIQDVREMIAVHTHALKFDARMLQLSSACPTRKQTLAH